MANLLEETIYAIKESGKTIEDVMFIGSADGKYRLSFDEFKEISDVWYDNGYGAQKVAMDLMIYFYDGSYLVRGEYDGSEWWEIRRPKVFKPDDEYEKYNRAICTKEIVWETLRSMAERDNEDE